MRVPETKYVKSGDYNIAYSAAGDGPPDLAFVTGYLGNVEIWWEAPAPAAFFERLASFARVIHLDKRGTGLSDHVDPTNLPTLEERADDLSRVLDAVQSERIALLGYSEGGMLSTLYAAAHPDRVSHLILIGSAPRFEPFADFDIEQWGSGPMLDVLAPSLRDDEALRQLYAAFERRTASPGSAQTLMTMINGIDLTDILPVVQVPTLILHRTDDQAVPIAGGRLLADRIPGATLIELPGRDHDIFNVNPESILDPIEEFITGTPGGGEVDRVLATVLFTDIVDSTRRLADKGDAVWRRYLDEHDQIVRDAVERFAGRVVKGTGDGVLCTFDGPGRAVRCARSILDHLQQAGIPARAGLHSGEIEMRDDDVAGLAVHIAARVSSKAGAGEVLVTSTVRDLVAGGSLTFEERGQFALKGVPGEWTLLRLV